MKHLISALAIVTLVIGAGACTVDGESPEVDLSTLELRSDFEVIIIEPSSPRDPRLVTGELPARASAGELSFGDHHYLGGASSALAAEGDTDLTFEGQPFQPTAGATWRGYQIEPTERPTFEGHELDTAADLPQQLDDPCLCTGAACLRDWVDANVGCDICAVFVCGEGVTPHACNACQ